jgi:hypothetical protein
MKKLQGSLCWDLPSHHSAGTVPNLHNAFVAPQVAPHMNTRVDQNDNLLFVPNAVRAEVEYHPSIAVSLFLPSDRREG